MSKFFNGYMKRIPSIDALRGIGILTLTPYHTMLVFYPRRERRVGGQRAWNPLNTFPLFFFLISGMCLALSVERRRKNQNLKILFLHYLYRYGGYIVIGFLISLMVSLIDEFFVNLGALRDYLGIEGFYTWIEPIRGIGLACLVSFPIIYYLSWKQLLISSISLFISSLLILLNIENPYLFGYITPVLITGMYSLLKTVPTVLFGAAIGKIFSRKVFLKDLIEKNIERDFLSPKRLTILGLIILLIADFIYISMVYSLFSNIQSPFGFLILFLRKFGGPYYLETISNLGGFIFIFGLFERLRLKGYRFRPLTFVGQTGIQIFVVHLPLLILLRSFIDPTTLTELSYLIIIVFTAVLMYMFSYFYVKYNINSKILYIIRKLSI